MRIFHIGEPDQRLLATLHLPDRSRPRTTGVLLCNPFGEEAARAHRLYRVLATQLERAGYPTLRFDYSHTGDSAGDSRAATLDAWLRDITTAATELQTTTGVRRIALVGMRLGATLAALAAGRDGLRVRHAVLWDPVIDGRSYLNELTTQHTEYMQSEIEGWVVTPSPTARPAEALGHPIPPALADQIAAIDLERTGVTADHVTVITTTSLEPGPQRFVARLLPAQAPRHLTIDADAAWNSDAAVNASVVPMTVLRAIIGRIQEVSP